MSKLTVMKYNQIMMAVLGIYPLSFSSPSLNRLQSLSPYLMIISLMNCNILAALYAYQETRLSLMVQALILVIGGSQSISAYLNMKWKMNRAGHVNTKLQGVVDQGIDFEHFTNVCNLISFSMSYFSSRTKEIGIHLYRSRAEMSSIHQANGFVRAIPTSFVCFCIFLFDLLHLRGKFRYIHVLFAASLGFTIQN